MNIKKYLILVSLLILNGNVSAQVCPYGAYPGKLDEPQICRPPPNETSEPSQPQVRWENRWGAIATDVINGKLGAVVGMRTKKQAQKLAMSECRSKGGKKCTVDIVYYNQCAVMILGNKKYNTASAANIEEATRIGMKTCFSSDANCRVYYSDCSPAERVR